MVGFLSGSLYAAVLGDDVSAEDYGRRRCRVARSVQGILEPFPLLVNDGVVKAVGIGVEVVHQQNVGTDSLVPRTTGRAACTYAEEGASALGGELCRSPFAQHLLLAVERLDSSVALEVRLVRCKQLLRALLRGTGENNIVLLLR